MRLRKADAVVHVHAFCPALVMWLCWCIICLPCSKSFSWCLIAEITTDRSCPEWNFCRSTFVVFLSSLRIRHCHYVRFSSAICIGRRKTREDANANPVRTTTSRGWCNVCLPCYWPYFCIKCFQLRV